MTAGIREFIDTHFSHFNAGELKRAARACRDHLDQGGRLLLTLAGAMSTAGAGRILAPAIRAGLVHGICCTGANLEEDAYRLIGGDTYRFLPEWFSLSASEEAALDAAGLNRVTDTAIPDQVMLALEEHLHLRWQAAANSARSVSPAELMLDTLQDPELVARFVSPETSWLLAAGEHGVPIWTPGWEDSTTGNAFAAAVLRGEIAGHAAVESGTAQMTRLVRWYVENCRPEPGIGLVQVGGGIAGDFAICVVPLIRKELQMPDIPVWGYFCQITDATASYGGYSGAPPNEKISWGKLDQTTPRFSIQSDATLALPLLLAYLLDG